MEKEFFYKLKLIFFPCRENKYYPKFLGSKFLFYYALLLLLLKLIILPFLIQLPKTAFFADLTKINLIRLTNQTRESFGSQALKENLILNEAAFLKAKDMIEKGYFAHYSPEGITPWYWLEKSGYNYLAAGENLAIGFLESEEVHKAWMESSSHQENILNPAYQEIGIAVVKGTFQGKETSLVVQYFGEPKIMLKEAVVDTTTKGEEEEEIFLPEGEIRFFAESMVKGERGEIISSVQGESLRKTPIFFLFQFMINSYYNLLQKVIYFSLGLIIILSFLTIIYDVFVYRKFEIQYQDAIFKVIIFATLWFILIFLDKMIMIQLINSNHFMIY